MPAVIPTMHISGPLLENPSEMIVYILRHFTSIPSGISNTFTDKEISFQKLKAQYGHDGKSLASATANTLSKLLNRIFKDDTIAVECKAITIPDTSRYNISIDISMVKNNEAVNISGVLKITDSGQATINFSSGA